MTAPDMLDPTLLTVLDAVSRRQVWWNRLVSGRRRWFMGDTPATAAVECLIDAALVEAEPDSCGDAALTAKGRELLDSPNPAPEGHQS